MAQTALRRGTQEDGNSDYFTGCPIGGGFIWYGLPDKIPSNCMICDNSTLAIANFAKLHENLGGAWGTSGANLNIPDLRGRFPRGVDAGANRDLDKASRAAANAGGNTADAVGSVQDDAMQKITANISSTTWRNGDMGTYSGAFFKSGSGTNTGAAGTNTTPALGFDSSLSPGAKTSNNETRPTNANVYFVIRVS